MISAGALGVAVTGTALASRRVASTGLLSSPLGFPLVFASVAQAVLNATLSRSRMENWSIAYPGESPYPKDLTRVCFANVLNTNASMAHFIDEIAGEDPDVLVLAESDSGDWRQAVRTHLPSHGYSFWEQSAIPGASLLVSSRQPVTHMRSHYDAQERPYLTWRMQLKSGRWTDMVAVHPAAPVSRRLTRQWAQYLSAVRDSLPPTGPLILIGDFNATPQHGLFANLVSSLGCHVATEGVPTWPQNDYAYHLSHKKSAKLVGRARWLLSLDHILLRDVQAWRVWVGTGSGSDHRPVFADVAIA